MIRRRCHVRKHRNFLIRTDTDSHKNKLTRDEDEEDPAKQRTTGRRSQPKEME